MHDAHLGPVPRQPSPNLHQAARITRDHSLHTRTLNRIDLLVQNRERNFRILDRESPAEATTSIRVLELDELSATHVSNQSSRLCFEVEIAQTVTCVVPR